MCHYISISVTGGAQDPAELFRAHGLHSSLSSNPHIRAAMPAGTLLLDVTHGGCSCSIAVGPSSKVIDAEVERARYARKGWSAAKIDRAVKAKQSSLGHRPANDTAMNFRKDIRELVRSGSRVALISHYYSGRCADEVVSVGSRTRMSVDEFVLSHDPIPEDTLLVFE